MSKRAPKTKTLKILDEATMSYQLSYLYNVLFAMKSGDDHWVQVYAPKDNEVLPIANRLYENKGTFITAILFERA